MADERSKLVFKSDIYIAADDGNIYHLKEGEWNSEVNLAAESRERDYIDELLHEGVTVGVLLKEVDVKGHGQAQGGHHAGTCYLLNLNALKHRNKHSGTHAFDPPDKSTKSNEPE